MRTDLNALLLNTLLTALHVWIDDYPSSRRRAGVTSRLVV